MSRCNEGCTDKISGIWFSLFIREILAYRYCLGPFTGLMYAASCFCWHSGVKISTNQVNMLIQQIINWFDIKSKSFSIVTRAEIAWRSSSNFYQHFMCPDTNYLRYSVWVLLKTHIIKADDFLVTCNTSINQIA